MRKITSSIISILLVLMFCSSVVYADTAISKNCNHDMYLYYETPASCTHDGYQYYRCANCNLEETKIITSTGHNFGEWYYSNEWYKPDCENSGTMVQDCQNINCSEQNSKTVEPLGHSFGNWYYESELDKPSCYYSGTLTKDCQREGCYESTYKRVNSLGHNYKKHIYKARPNYDGYVEYICTRCDVWGDYYNISAPSKIKLSTSTYIYNGKVKKPTVKVYNENGSLIKPSHYTVSYDKGRKNVGKYTVKVTFKSSSEKYKGSFKTSFKIKPKSTYVRKLIKGKGSFTVKWKKNTAQISGYQIKYSRYSDMESAYYKTIKSKNTTSYKFSNLSGNKKYYVQVRTYKIVKGTKYYSSWSKKKSITTKRYSQSYKKKSSNNNNDSYLSYVYVTRTGECYHTHACGRGTYYKSSLSSALSRGLRACKKCF